MTDFARLLNPEQLAAATAGDGPLLVLAAAGTGKTRTLVHRVAYLLEKGVPPERVLLLTFTNRAAREMIDRAEAVVGGAAHSIWSGTFHSVCARLLRRHAPLLGYENGFRILDEDDQRRLVGEAIKGVVANPKDFPKKEVVAKMISEAANERLDVADIAARWSLKVAGFSPEEVAKVADAYAKAKREASAMDFDDLLLNGLALLQEHERVRESLQERFLHVLVDEYQDTNAIQADFTDILAARHRCIMAVGDDFQCIYTWRGARIENIMEFPRRWEGCRIVKLERNYRSVPGVLDVANVVMKDAPDKFGKTLRPNRAGDGELPRLCFVYDGRAQADEVVRAVVEMRRAGFRYSDIAVLYRSHFQSIDIQMAFARNAVPHRITSGVGVFEQVHVKDVLAFLRIVTDPADSLSFMRFAQLLPGVGEKGARSLWEKAGRRFDAADPDAMERFGAMLGAKAKPLWPAIRACLAAAGERFEADAESGLVEDFCNFFYEDYLRGEWEAQEAEDRLDDVKELAAQIAASADDRDPAECPDAKSRLRAFLSDVALLTNLDARRNETSSDKVTLSTVHQAKGMEWPVVVVPWLSEGMFPSAKAEEDGRIDEERRLFYVAVTRAKDRLHLFVPSIRRMADGGMFPVEQSRFVRELPRDLLDVRRASYEPASGFAGYGGGRGYGGTRGFGYGGGRGFGGGRPGPALKTTWRR